MANIEHPTSQEHYNNQERDEAPQSAESVRELSREEKAQAEHEQAEKLIQARAEAESKAQHETYTKSDAIAPTSPVGMRKEQRQEAYQKSLSSIRRELSGPGRSFSKFIHQPAIEKASALAGNTIMRPSLALGAALGAFVGGTVLYFLARKYGFRLSGSEFLLTGLAGAFLGVLLELFASLARKLFRSAR
jgi:hypothetical protein